MLKTSAIVVVAGVAFMSLGCQTSQTVETSGSAILREAGVQERDDIIHAKTELVHGDGTKERLGFQPHSASAIKFVKLVPLSAMTVDEGGRLTGFEPALPPAEGVTAPPVGVALDCLSFDEHGRLTAWKATPKDALAGACCKVMRSAESSGGGGAAYACVVMHASASGEYIVTYQVDESGRGVVLTSP